MPTDIVIQSQLEVDGLKNNTGYLTYYILEEGIKNIHEETVLN